MEQESNSGEITLDLRSLFAYTLHRWWIVLICLVVGLVAGFGFARIAGNETYSADAVFVVSYHDASSEGDQYSYQSRIASLLGGCVTLIQQNRFADAVVEELEESEGISVTRDEVMNCMSYSFSVSGSNTDYAGNYIYITASNESADMAYHMATAASGILDEYIADNYVLAGSSERLVFSLANDIEMPTQADSSISTAASTIIGGLLFVVVCIIVFAVIEVVDKRVKGEDDLRSQYDIAVLGSVPDFNDKNIAKGGYRYDKE